MRVAFLVTRVVRTGPNTNMMAVLTNLPEGLGQVDVLALDTGSDPAMVAELAAHGVALEVVGGRSVAAQRTTLRDLVSSRAYDLVVSCAVRPDILNVLSVPRRKRIVIKQEPAFTPFRGPLLTIVVRVWHLLVISRARSIVSVSRHVEESLPRVLHGLSTVIPNAVDLERFRPPSPSERQSARQALGVDDATRVVAFAGTLDDRKRPHLVADVVRELRSEGHPVRLLIAGDGPMRPRLEARGEAEAVTLLGFQNDIRELLWAADAFALPSTHEGLPLAAMEALACGLPLVLSDIAPHRELVEGAESAGQVVDVTDGTALKGAVRWALESHGDAGPRRLAEERLNARAMAQAYAALFESLQG